MFTMRKFLSGASALVLTGFIMLPQAFAQERNMPVDNGFLDAGDVQYALPPSADTGSGGAIISTTDLASAGPNLPVDESFLEAGDVQLSVPPDEQPDYIAYAGQMNTPGDLITPSRNLPGNPFGAIGG